MNLFANIMPQKPPPPSFYSSEIMAFGFQRWEWH